MTSREAAIKVVRVLRRGGFQALLAGGCVRDMLLGRRASDYDVATDARPEDVEHVYRRVADDGPVTAGDLSERTGPKGSWWDWDHAKLSLEYLFWVE